MTTERFWRWFEVEMQQRGYHSVRQVERAGDVGNDTISGRQRRGAPPTDTVIRAVAQAFDMSFEAVRKVADAVPSDDGAPAVRADEQLSQRPNSLTLRELWGIVSRMPIEDQRAVLDYALFRRSRTDERGAQRQPRAREANDQSPAATDGG